MKRSCIILLCLIGVYACNKPAKGVYVATFHGSYVKDGITYYDDYNFNLELIKSDKKEIAFKSNSSSYPQDYVLSRDGNKVSGYILDDYFSGTSTLGSTTGALNIDGTYQKINHQHIISGTYTSFHEWIQYMQPTVHADVTGTFEIKSNFE